MGFHATLTRATRASPASILVLGGSGVFGGRIAGALCRDPRLSIVIAGRNENTLRAKAAQLESVNVPHPPLEGRKDASSAHPIGVAVVDVGSAESLRGILRSIAPKVVIHTAGPFKPSENYAVARMCIEEGIHYVDIADSRCEKCGFIICFGSQTFKPPFFQTITTTRSFFLLQ